MPSWLERMASQVDPDERDLSREKTQKTYAVKKTKDEWKSQLDKEQYRVLRKKGTEAPGSHPYDKHYPDKNGSGVYKCVGCDAPLYKAAHKFNSGCGWPAFFDAIPGAVTTNKNSEFGGGYEIWCHNCGGHLGHVFRGEGFKNPTNERHCVNGVTLNWVDGEVENTAPGSKV